MATAAKCVQLDLFIKEKEEIEATVFEARKRNFSRRFNHLFGELMKLQGDLEKAGFCIEKNPKEGTSPGPT
jgi:hypothetical protein